MRPFHRLIEIHQNTVKLLLSENEERIENFEKLLMLLLFIPMFPLLLLMVHSLVLGAEIGISTQKLHARGPMALEELTSYKWIIEGEGQVRPNILKNRALRLASN